MNLMTDLIYVLCQTLVVEHKGLYSHKEDNRRKKKLMGENS